MAIVLALEQVSVINDIKRSEGMQEQSKSSQETTVSDKTESKFLLKRYTS